MRSQFPIQDYPVRCLCGCRFMPSLPEQRRCNTCGGVAEAIAFAGVCAVELGNASFWMNTHREPRKDAANG
jgi:hypothetical protein